MRTQITAAAGLFLLQTVCTMRRELRGKHPCGNTHGKILHGMEWDGGRARRTWKHGRAASASIVAAQCQPFPRLTFDSRWPAHLHGHSIAGHWAAIRTASRPSIQNQCLLVSPVFSFFSCRHPIQWRRGVSTALLGQLA
ncbi:hypothetical protein B0I35DRAFT_421535 [Stachybotrys elegans]|uniref:Secreted protein n=1 Tax=Stachybotrys elegans TaxID=80388 RepID=A0A8K0SZZ1_9HYPO|nr:hypothetical protein B0I35DRAFT_421535 [Stachybotrys elegans]